MKKILSLAALVGFGSVIAFSQTNNTDPKYGIVSDADEVIKLDRYGAEQPSSASTQQGQSTNSSGSRATGSKIGQVVGKSNYDLQSNSSIDDRFIINSDGTMSAVFTMAHTNAGYNDRGTGYLYYSGNNWTTSSPSARIEPERIGWPSIGVTKSGKEIIISHSTATDQLLLTHRPVKGTGAWKTVFDPNGAKAAKVAKNGYTLWPRMAIGGKNGETVHLIALSEPLPVTGSAFAGERYQGIDGAICYSRSKDGGVTWDQKSVVLKGLDSTMYDNFNADSYSIHAKGDVVAIAVFHRFNHTTILKSTDNGSTWKIMYALKMASDRYILGDYPVTDTIQTSDNTGDVVIDNKGEVHVMFGSWTWTDPDTSDRAAAGGHQYTTFPLMNGLNYWKESYGDGNFRRLVDFIDQDGNTGNFNIIGGINGLTNYGAKSLNGYPSIGVDANDGVYATFMGIMESDGGSKMYNDGTNHYRHQFVIKSMDGGCTWGSPMDLTDDGNGFEECVYGAMPPTVDDSVRVIYMEDLSPGTAVGPIAHADGVNEIVYVSVSKHALPNDTNKCLVVISGDKFICTGDSIWLSANPSCGSAYKWNNGATTAGIWVKTPGQYSCEVTTLCGKISDTVNITVPASGQGPKISLTSDLPVLCPSGSKTTLRVSHNSIGSSGFYVWNGGSQSFSDSLVITSPGTYNVEVSNCANGKSKASITIGAVSSAEASISGDKFLCSGDSTDLLVSENPGGIYTWTKSGSSTPLSNKRSVKVTQTGTYIVDVLACAGQFSAKDSIVVEVEPAPTAVIQAVGNTTVCKGQGTISLSASGQTGATFKWSNGFSGSIRNVNTDSVQTMDYFCYSFNACGDSMISNKINVIVNAIPVQPTITHSQGVYTAGSTTAHWSYKLKNTSVWKDAGVQGKIYTPTNLSVGDSVAAREKENGCFSPYSNAILFGSIGINDITNPNAELGVYPNPNNGIFNLSFTGINSMNIELSIRNMIGQEVMIKAINLTGNHIEEINLSSVESGFYMLTVSNGEQQFTQRVLIR